MRPIALLLSCAGCSTPGPEETFPLGWESFLVSEGTPIISIEAGLRFRNASDQAVTIQVPTPCSAVIRAYQLPASPSSRYWDQRVWNPNCSLAFGEITLNPGQTYVALSGSIPVAEILGDSLPPGNYQLIVTTYSEDLPNGEVALTAAEQIVLTRQ